MCWNKANSLLDEVDSLLTLFNFSNVSINCATYISMYGFETEESLFNVSLILFFLFSQSFTVACMSFMRYPCTFVTELFVF